MGEVTHQQVDLFLRLYEMRREARLREAREWFMSHFYVASIEELQRVCPPTSHENASLRMVFSYWEMVANIVNRGLIDEDFFFENSGEQWIVWERIKGILPAWRSLFKNPHMLSHLEKHIVRFEAWREKRSPGSNEAIRAVLAQMRTQTAGKGS